MSAVTMNVAALRAEARKAARAAGHKSGKRSGTKVRKGIRQTAAAEIRSVIEAANGKTANGFATMLDGARKAVAAAEADAKKVNPSDLDAMMRAVARVTAARMELRQVEIAAAAGSKSLADAEVDVRLARVAGKVLASWNAYLSDDEERAKRIGSFHEEKERATVRAGIVAMLESVLKVLESDKVGNHNGYRA